MKEETKEKQLFDMVYQWGRVGLVTDEKCQAFQDLINEIQREKISLQKKEILEKVERYEKFVRKELDNADEKDLTMIAYDMHSRLVAIKHIIKKLLT